MLNMQQTICAYQNPTLKQRGEGGGGGVGGREEGKSEMSQPSQQFCLWLPINQSSVYLEDHI